MRIRTSGASAHFAVPDAGDGFYLAEDDSAQLDGLTLSFPEGVINFAPTGPAGNQFVIGDIPLSDLGAFDLTTAAPNAIVTATQVAINQFDVTYELQVDFQIDVSSIYFLEAQFRILALARVTDPTIVIGDASGDCSVGAADYAIWAAQFGQTNTGLSADFDANGSVGAGDYALWAANFGDTCTAGGSSVPEPSAWGLVLCGVAILLSRFRRNGGR